MNEPLIPVAHPSEAGHWYRPDGTPAYEIVGKNGQRRPTTLRDAKNLGLVPSVTTIIASAARPGLENWKIDQGILAALTLPRGADESEKDWLARVKLDSAEQARKAAERGTQIHASIERMYRDDIWPPDEPEPAPSVWRVIEDYFGDQFWEPEVTFARRGIAGKVDLASKTIGDSGIIIDFKGKYPSDFDSVKPRLAFDEHAMQLAAYRYGLGWDNARCANVFFGRFEPWRVAIHEWSEDDLQRAYGMFDGLLHYWYAKSGLEPEMEWIA